MNLPDRLLCLLLGHTWEPVTYQDANRCPHCETTMTAIQVVTYWRRRIRVVADPPWAGGLIPPTRRIGSDLPGMDALRMGWPKRVWSVR